MVEKNHTVVLMCINLCESVYIKLNKTEKRMTLKFSDGMEFDTSGEPRIESRSDGLYVVGNGQLIPVSSREEAEEIIKRDKEKKLNHS
jgi:hypothetical protein